MLIATLFSIFGSSNPLQRGAAVAMARRLPIVMTYVINLGIPPLLFAQVLYGPALYTSNVLIGLYWFSIIFLLMACYWYLYGFSDGVAAGKSVWWKGLLAWVLAGCISRILSTNMALMLKPEVWHDMYSSAALGNHLPPYDPTLMPRWLFMLAGAGWVTGLWMVWIAGRKSVQAPLNQYLSMIGGRLAAVMVIVQGSQFFLILKSQPAVVTDGLALNPLFKTASMGWCAMAAVIFLFAIWVAIKKPCSYAVGYISVLFTVITIAAWTILRDGIRDLTLASKGFNVWQQGVVTNWQVVGIFFLVFALGVGSLVWLISVMMRSKPIPEGGLS